MPEQWTKRMRRTEPMELAGNKYVYYIDWLKSLKDELEHAELGTFEVRESDNGKRVALWKVDNEEAEAEQFIRNVLQGQ